MRKHQGALGILTVYRIFELYPALNPDWFILGKGTMIRGVLPQNTEEFMNKIKTEQELKKKIAFIDDTYKEIKQLQATFDNIALPGDKGWNKDKKLPPKRKKSK